jgi:hypothetical protein
LSRITNGKVPFIDGGLRLQYAQDAVANPPLGPDTATAVIAEIAYGVLKGAGLDKYGADDSVLHRRCLTRDLSVAWAVLDNDTVLFDLRTGARFTLNRAGSFMWQRLDGKHTLHDIAEELHGCFDVSYSQAQTEIFTLAEHMFQQQLVSCLGDSAWNVSNTANL